MYVNKKDLILIFCTKYCFMDLKSAILHVQFSVRAEYFACASTYTSYHKHLIGKPGYTGFYDDIWTSLLLFRFSDVMLIAFSQSKIRTPKKLGTPQRF